MKTKKEWKPWHSKILNDLRHRGESNREIAEKLGFAVRTVIKKAKILGFSPKQEYEKLQEKHRHLMKVRDRAICEDFSAGKSKKELAEEWGLTPMRVHQIINQKAENG